MGDPKFSRPKYSGPSHPWQGERIKAEKELVKKYGLKNKKELWKAQSVLRRFRRTARNLQARLRTEDAQAEKERDELVAKLVRIGLLSDESDLNDILALEVEAVLNRRLQTIVHLKGMAYSANQSRQFISHGHISLRGRKVTIPGYLVRTDEDDEIAYKSSSPIANELHPMRPKPEMERELEKAEASVGAMEDPAKKTAEKPAKKTAEKPAKKTAEKPVEKPAEKPAKKTTEKTAEKPAEKTTEKTTEKPAEKKEESDEKIPSDLNVAPGDDAK